MKWAIEYLDEAQKDVRRLDGSQRKQYAKAIDKVCQNPLPANEGGYGTPLGNKGGRNLTGLLKIKLKQSGIRIVYRLVRQDDKWSSSSWECARTKRSTTRHGSASNGIRSCGRRQRPSPPLDTEHPPIRPGHVNRPLGPIAQGGGYGYSLR